MGLKTNILVLASVALGMEARTGDDHSDAVIHKYPEAAVKWISTNIPCHLVV